MDALGGRRAGAESAYGRVQRLHARMDDVHGGSVSHAGALKMARAYAAALEEHRALCALVSAGVQAVDSALGRTGAGHDAHEHVSNSGAVLGKRSRPASPASEVRGVGPDGAGGGASPGSAMVVDGGPAAMDSGSASSGDASLAETVDGGATDGADAVAMAGASSGSDSVSTVPTAEASPGGSGEPSGNSASSTAAAGCLLPAGYSSNQLVAARCPTTDGAEEWLLARVLCGSANGCVVVAEAEDPPESGSLGTRHVLPVSSLHCLPTPESPLLPLRSRVLALFPGTTAFYPAVVVALPSRRRRGSEYAVRFSEDTSPSRHVPPLYVVPQPSMQ